ncbi:mediator of RNA polymerase II transcription subunit 8 [Drosophila madeirensis]|uniref:Mediator of RNA polymerase II transcription subunit 8 n=2 Tax=obscura subgroup TaxID=32357 RepID=A0A3B0JJY3_DROGU|nr:mediator of RNA polymerase II transcription subunit 8 [Drosophila guanche]XP_034654664.1 mediator of RNA polymerase II transcription subunit 8 [Drosophila subobscura]SPP72921.1 blast:Mediator of RNA polymerase II transcription subunit 8 [Drosophila guanche]
MQREEKHFEMTLDAVLQRLNDLKLAVLAMIQKLEMEFETINWPTFLDNFAIISSHLTGLTKILAKEQCPPLRNRTVLPLLVSMDRDETLIGITEGRVPVFSHDIVPDYLRTRPDPLTEQKMQANEQKAANLTNDAAMKQVTQYNKVVSHVLDMVSKAREEWEIESSSRTGIQQTSSMADTQLLVAAVGMGKGMKMTSYGPGPNMMVPPSIRASSPMGGPAMSPGNVQQQLGKAPSAVKTNIKAANQVHPFSR